MKKKYIIGIDEVGRGPLAGPVVVAAVAMPKGMRIRKKKLGALKDSKKLTSLRRERWYAHVVADPRIVYALSAVSPRVIDRVNITCAANRAALRVYKKLVTNYKSRIAEHRVYLDGGLYLGRKNKSKFLSLRDISRRETILNLSAPGESSAKRQFPTKGAVWMKNSKLSLTHGKQLVVKTIIRGDEKINAVKIASIIAKCHRDRFMVRLAKKYPAYGFDVHKGYGTRIHITAIKRHGISHAHRKSFCGTI